MQGFQSVYKPQRSGAVQFAELLDAVASVDPEMRIRFTSPHPKDFSDDVLKVSTLLPAMPQLHVINLCQAASSVNAASSCRPGFAVFKKFYAYFLYTHASAPHVSACASWHTMCAELALMHTLSVWL